MLDNHFMKLVSVVYSDELLISLGEISSSISVSMKKWQLT